MDCRRQHAVVENVGASWWIVCWLKIVSQDVRERARPIVFATFSGGAKSCLYKVFQVLVVRSKLQSICIVCSCFCGFYCQHSASMDPKWRRVCILKLRSLLLLPILLDRPWVRQQKITLIAHDIKGQKIVAAFVCMHLLVCSLLAFCLVYSTCPPSLQQQHCMMRLEFLSLGKLRNFLAVNG
jgi:hypothetical protein